MTMMDSGAQGEPMFVAHSLVWSPSKQLTVELMFEGIPKMLSQTGKAAEMKAMETSAESILLSVE
jgi:hypothetical protein